MNLQVAAIDPVVVRDHQLGELRVLVLDRLQRPVQRDRDELEAVERTVLEVGELLLVVKSDLGHRLSRTFR